MNSGFLHMLSWHQLQPILDSRCGQSTSTNRQSPCFKEFPFQWNAWAPCYTMKIHHKQTCVCPQRPSWLRHGEQGAWSQARAKAQQRTFSRCQRRRWWRWRNRKAMLETELTKLAHFTVKYSFLTNAQLIQGFPPYVLKALQNCLSEWSSEAALLSNLLGVPYK